MILREQLGISADGSESVYRSDDIESFVARTPDVLAWTDRDHRQNIEHFFVAVDSSGGGPSAFAICSLICLPSGSIQVRIIHTRHTCPTRPTYYSLSSLNGSNGSGSGRSELHAGVPAIFSPVYIKQSVLHRLTNESGRCPKFSTKSGPINGRTRFLRSSTNSGSDWQNMFAKSGSFQTAKRTTARLHEAPTSELDEYFLMLYSSRSDWQKDTDRPWSDSSMLTYVWINTSSAAIVSPPPPPVSRFVIGAPKRVSFRKLGQS